MAFFIRHVFQMTGIFEFLKCRAAERFIAVPGLQNDLAECQSLCETL